MNSQTSLLIGGDCGPTHGPAQGFPIEGYTDFVKPALDAVDLRFVNCMRTYSTRGVKMDHAPQVGQPIEMADIYTNGRFDAVTMANNHSYDSGPDALVDTRVAELARHPGDGCGPQPCRGAPSGRFRAQRREGRLPGLHVRRPRR